MGSADVFLEGFTVFQLLIIFVFGGGFIALLGVLWRISKRDSVIDSTIQILEQLAIKVNKLELKIDNDDDDISNNFKSSQERIVDIEKELIEIKTNQKNLLYSIDSQNYQILDLIDRLEKNHESFIQTQIKVNDKLELAINAIKDSLVNLSKN